MRILIQVRCTPRDGERARAARRGARSRCSRARGVAQARSSLPASGTEADNLAIARRRPRARPQGRTSSLRRSSITPCCTRSSAARRRLSTSTVLPVDADGRVDPARFSEAPCARRRSLASVMYAQQRDRDDPAGRRARSDRPRARRALSYRRGAGSRLASARRAASSASICSRSRRTSSTVRKGSARSTCARGTPIAPIIHGGGQEFGRARVPQNLAGIVGMAAALELARPSASSSEPAGRAPCATVSRAGILSAIPGRSQSTERSRGCQHPQRQLRGRRFGGAPDRARSRRRRRLGGQRLYLGQPRSRATSCARSASSARWQRGAIRFSLGSRRRTPRSSASCDSAGPIVDGGVRRRPHRRDCAGGMGRLRNERRAAGGRRA